MTSQKSISLQEFCSKANQENYLLIGQDLVATNVGKAFSYLSVGLSINNTVKEQYYKLYITAVESWSNKLIDASRFQDALKIYEVAQDIYRNSPDLDYLLARTLLRIGKHREAWEYSIKALSQCKHDPKAIHLASSLANSLVDRWHFPMLNDRERNLKYKTVIQKFLQKGHSQILDIGAGTGLLSIYAQKCGSAKIFACEMDEFLAEMASDILKMNSADDVLLLNKHSSDLQIPSDLPSRVSLVITETFDAGLFGEHVLVTLQHAWERLILSPTQSTINGSSHQTNTNDDSATINVLPSGAEIWIAVIECNYIAKQIKLIRNVDAFKDANISLELSEPYLCEKLNCIPGKYKLLTEWQKILDVDFNSLRNINRLLNGELNDSFQFPITSQGRGDAIVLAYKLHLDADTSLDTFPNSETCWENAIYPIYTLSEMEKGSRVTIDMKIDGVMHLSVPDTPIYSNLKTTDMEFLKCVNSKSYCDFYIDAAENFAAQNYVSKNFASQNFDAENFTERDCAAQKSDASFVVLDVCPYPQGGLALLEFCPNAEIFIGNENAFKILSQRYVKAQSRELLKSEVDVIFYWPFSADGTLRDNLLEELKSYRNILKDGGRIYPEYLDIQTVGIESDMIQKMTRVDDANTSGVRIAEVFNLLRTQHHLDIPIQGIPYALLTPVLNPLSIAFRDLKVIHSKQEAEELPPSGYLIVGGEVTRSSSQFQALGHGRIDGFVYWFELSNKTRFSKSPQSETSSSESSLSDDNDYELSKQTTFEMGALQRELQGKTIPFRKKDELTFSSFSRDSPVNQCILILDEPINVSVNQNLKFNFAFSEGQLSVNCAKTIKILNVD